MIIIFTQSSYHLVVRWLLYEEPSMMKLFLPMLKMGIFSYLAFVFPANPVWSQTQEPPKLAKNAPLSAQSITSVSQLRDVKPTDWAFQALQSLIERYGCLSGYPNGTYNGDRTLTRYEFAAGLNACLEQIAQFLEARGNNVVSQEDLATIERLQSDFQNSLATLRDRVDSLETRTSQLQNQQFSTTTKLQGEGSFFLSGALGDEQAGDSQGDIDENTTLSHRTRLILNTSFTGKDLLKTFLVAANSTNFANATGTNMSRLAFDVDTNNNFINGKMFYRFPISDRLQANIDIIGGNFFANIPTLNEFFTPEITGALSRFGRFNPIYRQGLGGSGVTVSYEISNSLSIYGGYLARNASNSGQKQGLFDGHFAALGQIQLSPVSDLRLTGTYIRSYFPGDGVALTGGTGSKTANQPFGDTATSGNHFGLQASWNLTPDVTLGSWTGVTLANAEDRTGQADTGDDATIWNWAVTLAVSNLDRKGSQAGLVVGQPPKVTHNDGGEEDGETAWHVEGFYRYQVTEGIAIEPGIVTVFNPEHEGSNDAIVIGNIRTIFLF
jgi:hypothetical protein